MFKKITEKLEIKLWALPTLILIFLMIVLFITFKVTAPNDGQGYIVEPESGREVILLSIVGVLFVTYLWVLLYLYSGKGKRPLSRWTKRSVILLTALFIWGLFCRLLLYLYK